MIDGYVWFGIAGLLIAVELFTGTFYLLMIALGLGAGGLVAFLIPNLFFQVLVAATVGLVSVFLLHRVKSGSASEKQVQHDSVGHFDVGQQVHVSGWKRLDNGVHRARVQYRGTWWDAELLSEESPEPGFFTICAVRGLFLMLK